AEIAAARAGFGGLDERVQKFRRLSFQFRFADQLSSRRDAAQLQSQPLGQNVALMLSKNCWKLAVAAQCHLRGPRADDHYIADIPQHFVQLTSISFSIARS